MNSPLEVGVAQTADPIPNCSTILGIDASVRATPADPDRVSTLLKWKGLAAESATDRRPASALRG